MSPAGAPFLVPKALWTGAAQWTWGHAVLLTVLLAALVAKVVLQGAVRSPNPKVLRALSLVTVPLLIVFLAVVVQRFRYLGH